MRRRDKTKNMLKANRMAEQYYLESKGIIAETTVVEGAGMTHAAGFADGGSGFVNGGGMMKEKEDEIKESDTSNGKVDPKCETCGGSGRYETNTGNGHDVEAVCPCVK